MNLLIAADIGNSSISIGYFTASYIFIQRIPTHPAKSIEDYRRQMNEFIRENNIEKGQYDGIISSVVSGHTEIIAKAIQGLSEIGVAAVIIADHRMSGIGFKINSPHELGTDRIADAVAAFSLFKKPVIVVDFGTATTITVVDGDGDYIGGSIMPGIGLMNESLKEKTSKLDKVEIEAPKAALGKDTASCIRTGLLIGTAGAVERIISEIEQETGLVYETVLTGGYAPAVEGFMKRRHVSSAQLTLEGLRVLYEKNRPQ